MNEEARTADLTWTTGADVLREDFWTGKRYVERLSLKPEHVRLDRLNQGAPLLNSHNAFGLEDVIGVVVSESVKLKAKSGTATVRFSERESVAPIFQDVRDGILRNVSVGYRVFRYDIKEPKDPDKGLEIRTAVDWEPGELSLVPMGADPKAQVREGEPLTYRNADLGTALNECELVREQADEAWAGEAAGECVLSASDLVEIHERKKNLELMESATDRTGKREDVQPTERAEPEQEHTDEVHATTGLSDEDRRRRARMRARE